MCVCVYQVTPDSQNDFGSYNCTARNDVGVESKEFLLIEAGWSSDCFLSHVYTSQMFRAKLETKGRTLWT